MYTVAMSSPASSLRARLRQAAVSAVHGALKNAPAEQLLRLTHGAAPPALRGWWPRVAPQPSDYAPNERRRFRTRGLRFELAPSSYFQWHHYFGFDDPVLDVLATLAVGARTIVDVGANVGLYALVMARAAGPAARVHAFEPFPETIAVLRAQLALNADTQVEAHAVALGEVEETRRIFVSTAADAGKSTLVAAREGLADAGLAVQVSTLDAFAAARGPLDLVKIDVEGHEPATMRGARATLARDRPDLVLELSPEWWPADETGAVFAELDALGYALHEIPAPGAAPTLAPRTWREVLAARRQWNLVALSARRGEPEARARAIERLLPRGAA